MLIRYDQITTFCRRQSQKWRAIFKPCARHLTRAHRGQSYVEMVFTVMAVAVVIITAIEGSIILNRGMAVRQLAYQGARYAAANPGSNSAAVLAYVANAEPTVLTQGTIQVSMSPSTAPRTQGTAVSVSVSFTGPTVAVPSIIHFPRTISATNTTMNQ
jgi:hypothetical protein